MSTWSRMLLPIGKPEILKRFTPATPLAFYTRWYRPDRMAPVVVGDIDPSAIEQSLIPPITASEDGEDGGKKTEEGRRKERSSQTEERGKRRHERRRNCPGRPGSHRRPRHACSRRPPAGVVVGKNPPTQAADRDCGGLCWCILANHTARSAASRRTRSGILCVGHNMRSVDAPKTEVGHV
jgi:hypothetical protein